MFNDMLKTQLILKNIITPEDWEIMSEHIQYDFLYDNHFAELKEAELTQERLNLLASADPMLVYITLKIMFVKISCAKPMEKSLSKMN